MTYDPAKPADGSAPVAADMRENFRALKEDQIVNAGQVAGHSYSDFSIEDIYKKIESADMSGESEVADSKANNGYCRRYTQPGTGMADHTLAYYAYDGLRYGTFSLNFRLKSSNNTTTSNVAALRVEKPDTTLLKEVLLQGTDFQVNNDYCDIPMVFKHVSSDGASLVFKTVSKAVANVALSIDCLIVMMAQASIYTSE